MIEFHEINVGGSISKNDACLTKLKKETMEIHTHKYKLLATILKWELLWHGNSFGYLVICNCNSYLVCEFGFPFFYVKSFIE